MTKGEIAKKYFECGKNCSQAVALAFCPEMGLSEEIVERQTIGFGGGMGRMREVCGTVSGMTYVISNLYGGCGRAAVYAMVQEVAKRFEAENGSIICRVLLGLDKNDRPAPTPEARTAEYYKNAPARSFAKWRRIYSTTLLKTKNNKTFFNANPNRIMQERKFSFRPHRSPCFAEICILCKKLLHFLFECAILFKH